MNGTRTQPPSWLELQVWPLALRRHTSVCVSMCMRVCVSPVHSSAPEAFPTLGVWFFKRPPSSLGVPGLLEKESTQGMTDSHLLVLWPKQLGQGGSLRVLVASSVIKQ